jgi:hypothetical protein
MRSLRQVARRGQGGQSAENQFGGEIGGRDGVDRSALEHLVAHLSRHGDTGRGEVVGVDPRGAAMFDGPGEGVADFLEHPLHLRGLDAHVRLLLAGGAADLPGFVLVGDEIEIGLDRGAQVAVETVRRIPAGPQDRPEPRRAVVGQGLEHLIPRAEVVVEGAGGEAGAADDVAHGGHVVAQFGEHLPGGVQNRPAVGDLGLLAFSRGKNGGVIHPGHAIRSGRPPGRAT